MLAFSYGCITKHKRIGYGEAQNNIRGDMMVMYYSECGHTTTGMIFIDNSDMSMIQYLLWAETEGHLEKQDVCFPCWLKKQEVSE